MTNQSWEEVVELVKKIPGRQFAEGVTPEKWVPLSRVLKILNDQYGNKNKD